MKDLQLRSCFAFRRLVRDFFTVFGVLVALITFSMLSDRIADLSSWSSIAHTLSSISFLGLTLLAGPCKPDAVGFFANAQNLTACRALPASSSVSLYRSKMIRAGFTSLFSYPSQILTVASVIAIILFLFTLSLQWPNGFTRFAGIVGSLLWLLSGLGLQT